MSSLLISSTLLLYIIQAGKVVSAFRTSFSAALAVNFPTTLRDCCPLSQLNSLCRTVEGNVVLCVCVCVVCTT